MDSILLDGKKTAEIIRETIRTELNAWVAQGKKTPVLATILVGDNPSSHTYVNMKIKACEAVGMGSRLVKMPQTTTTEELLYEIDKLNADPEIAGILLQHPSPPQIDERLCFDRILLEKDVDGVTSASFGRLAMNQPTYYPCTPYGMILLLQGYKIPISGVSACVVGRSPILGKPMSLMLTNLDATVTLCHSRTQNLPKLVSQSQIVVGALGKPEYIQSEWIQQGAVLLDAGYNEGNVGDIDIKNAKHKSSHYTPVPGGVGPMTIAVLLLQTWYSCQGKFSPSLK